MLIAVMLGTYALKRALTLALNKDTIAMREINRRRLRNNQRDSYSQVGNEDDIEDAYE